MADEQDDSQGREPLSWRIRRWAAPVALAASLASSIVAVRLLTGDGATSAAPRLDDRPPRFMLAAGRMADSWPDDGPAPWFQVRALQQRRPSQRIDSVQPPSPSAAEVREILAGPEGTFVLSASRTKPCESRLYRFRLTGDGHVKTLEPLREQPVPALVAGLAMSPDGDRSDLPAARS